MTRVLCDTAVLAETIELLRRGGRLSEERVALWLVGAGTRSPGAVIEVYEPQQNAAIDYFSLPPASMRSLMRHLATTRRRIAAQIHTHPGRAFHSKADAAWAIVRHVGALSLVLPGFASATTPDNFLRQAKIYACAPTGEWQRVPGSGPNAMIEIVQ